MAAQGDTAMLRNKFLALLRNYPEPLTDGDVREYFQGEGRGEYAKLPSVINVLMGEVRTPQSCCVCVFFYRMSRL